MATHRLDIDAPIGFFDITSEQINRWFNKNVSDEDSIDVHINTPGGSVFESVAIFNRLDQHPGPVSMTVDGLAASGGSLILMAGDSIRVAKGAQIMIHEAWGMTIGDASDHQKTSEDLTRINGTLVDVYHARTGIDRDELRSMLAKETWMTGDEAREIGFADAETETEAPPMNFDLSMYRNVPKGFAAMQTPAMGSPVTPFASAPPAASPSKESKPMDQSTFKKAAADNPDWVAEFRESGIKAGVSDGRKELRDEAKAMLDAAGGDHKLAFESFVSGKSLETVEAVASDRAERDADAPADQSVGTSAEIAALRSQIDAMNGEEPVAVDGSAAIVDGDSDEAKKKARVADGAGRIKNKATRDQYIRSEGFDPKDFPQG